MTLRLNGSTSGYVELDAPAVAGTTALTLPDTSGTVAVQGEAYGRSATATVATNQTTTSSSYTDLATAGPAVTLTTGTKALVIVSARISGNQLGFDSYMSYAVSGATTVAAADPVALMHGCFRANTSMRASSAQIITGLTAGSNTFTAKYKVDSTSTGTFLDRTITVIDMGS